MFKKYKIDRYISELHGERLCLIKRLWNHYAHKAQRLVCKLLGGHRWEDHSIATPDTGDIDLVCSRCGYTYYKVLY